MSVRIKHSGLDRHSEVEEESVDVWISRGWAIDKDEKPEEVELSEGDKLIQANAVAQKKADEELATGEVPPRKSSKTA